MPSSATLRKQIESDFEHRYPSILTPAQRTIREVVPTGIEELDQLLNGGLPAGAISELTGPASSGRTTVAQAFLSQQTQNGSFCAWIDAADTFDPETASANGICLKQLLWVRCNSIATESVITKNSRFRNTQSWSRLEQALRATDLLLQAGGFTGLVLDLGDEKIEHCRRIPLASWFRFRQAADRSRCSLIVIGKVPYAQSSAAVVLECRAGHIDTSDNVIRSFSYCIQRRRERFSPITSIDRKPPVSTWSAQAHWNAQRRA